jgi:hypothetical protein
MLTLLIVDDGTGIIGCTYWINQGVETPGFKLGNLVSINGKLSVYNDQLQVTITTYRRNAIIYIFIHFISF